MKRSDDSLSISSKPTKKPKTSPEEFQRELLEVLGKCPTAEDVKKNNLIPELFGREKLHKTKALLSTLLDNNRVKPDIVAALAVHLEFEHKNVPKSLHNNEVYARIRLGKLKAFDGDKTQNALNHADDIIKLFHFTRNFYQHLLDNNEIKEKRDLEWQKRRFDSLSRLITLDSQCAAACFDGKKILIAFNEIYEGASDGKINRYERHTREVMEYLKKCTDDTFQDQDQRNDMRMKILKTAGSYYYKNTTEQAHDPNVIETIIQNLDKHNGVLPEEKSKEYEGDLYKAALRARRDLSKLEEALGKGQDVVKQPKLFSMSTLTYIDDNHSADGRVITNAFADDEGKGWEIIRDGERDSKCHAEMRIIENIAERSKKNPENILQNIYVGLSKLCCIDCNLVITKSGEIGIDIKNQQIFFEARGNHGDGFEWALIQSIRKNDKLFQEILGAAASASYSNLSAKDQEIAVDTIIRYISTATKEDATKRLGLMYRENNYKPAKGGVAAFSTSESELDEWARNAGQATEKLVSTKIRELISSIESLKDESKIKEAFNNVTEAVFQQADQHANLGQLKLAGNALLFYHGCLDDMIKNNEGTGIKFIIDEMSEICKKAKSINAEPHIIQDLSTKHKYISNIYRAGYNDGRSKEKEQQSKIYSQSNLKREEKANLKEGIKEEEFILKNEIYKANINHSELGTVIRQKNILLQEVPNKLNMKHERDMKPGSVTLMPENDHLTRHGHNVEKILSMLQNHNTISDMVIAIERKQEGMNLGMDDVKLLAHILKYNNNNTNKIQIPQAIKDLPIYQDAILYGFAAEKGIEVVGMEGKGIASNKDPFYSVKREEYMAAKLEQLAGFGKNIIFPVGDAHITALYDQLKTKGINVSIRADVLEADNTRRESSDINPSSSKDQDSAESTTEFVNAEKKSESKNHDQDLKQEIRGKFTARIVEEKKAITGKRGI